MSDLASLYFFFLCLFTLSLLQIEPCSPASLLLCLLESCSHLLAAERPFSIHSARKGRCWASHSVRLNWIQWYKLYCWIERGGVCVSEAAVFPPLMITAGPEAHMLFSSVSQRHFIEALVCFVTLFGTSITQTQTQGGIGRTVCFPHPKQLFTQRHTEIWWHFLS